MNRRGMLVTIRVALAAFCMTVAVAPTWAQNENENVGFRPNHIFESGNFGENVDILNGGLNLSTPVGPRFQINPRLGYGLTLAYNSKVWDTTYYENNVIYDPNERVVPSGASPFGNGFRMTMGRIYQDIQDIPDCNLAEQHTCFTKSWVWVSPDGTEHNFFFDTDEDTTERDEDGVLFGVNGEVTFNGRLTTDLDYTRFWGPGDQYCIGAKDDGSPETGCMRVETPDGLVHTLAKRVDCATPPTTGGEPTVGYQQVRMNNRSFCGWYTKYIEDPSIGSRSSSGGVTSPYPNHVKVTYDTRANFQHAIASVTDSATRSLTFHNCEWSSGGRCSVTTSQICNADTQCPSPQVCYTGICPSDPGQYCNTYSDCSQGSCEPIETTEITEQCMAGSKDSPTYAASSRTAVATYAVDVPAFANSASLSPSTTATYGFMYEFSRIRLVDDNVAGTVYTPTPVLKLLRLDYPGYTRPLQSDPDLYSLYYGYGGADYGELSCRTLPLLRKAGQDPAITDNACSQTGPWASFKYTYDYYNYIGKFLQASQHGVSVSVAGMTRQMVTKELQLPSGTSSGRSWHYDRGDHTSFTNPTQVTVSDPLGNDTVYLYHASQSSDTPGQGPDPSDGYAPEWTDGSNYQIDYYQGTSTTGRLLRSEIQEHDSDIDPDVVSGHTKSNVRVKRSITRYLDAGGKESVVSRDQWDGFGHWQSEVESGFDIDVPRRTRSIYVFPGTPYLTSLLQLKEVSDGIRVLSRTENEYDALGRLTTSISRAVLPAGIGTPVPAPLGGSATPGDVKTTFTYHADSGNIIRKELSTGRVDDPSYMIDYTYVPAVGGCTTSGGVCGGYLATKAFRPSASTPPPFKSIDRDRDANTGLIFATRDTAGIQTNYLYDALGRLTEVLPAGEEPTKVTYESLLQTSVTQGTPGLSDLDPEGNFILSRYLYDGLGRQVVTQKRPANPDGKFACQKTQYDVAGHVLYKSEWAFRTPAECQALPVPPQDVCAAYGIVRETDPGTELDYSEPATIPVGQATCDPFGRVRLEIPTDGDRATLDKVSRTDYSGTSHDVTINSIRGAGGSTTYSAKTSFFKDAFGRLTRVDAPNERRCLSNNVACTSDAQCGGGAGSCAVSGGADAYYDYDILDRLVQAKLTDNLSQIQIRRFDYDGLGKLIRADNPESGTTVYEGYDALGNLLRAQHPNGIGESIEYDWAGRTTKHKNWPAGDSGPQPGVSDTILSYDFVDATSPYGMGKVSVINRHAITSPHQLMLQERRYYNAVGGRLSSFSHTFPDWINNTTETTNYAYNTRGELTAIQYPQETPSNRTVLTVNYGYSNGMAVTATENGTGTLLGRVSYNAAGGVTAVDMPNGRTEITFDSRNRPKTFTGGAWNGSAWSRPPEYQSGTYEYDGAGNVYQIGSNLYGYDAVNRLITSHTNFQGSIFDETFFYDSFGNMNQRSLAPFGGSTETESLTYSTPRTNRIMTRQTTIEGSTAASAVNFTYDGNGNLREGGRRWKPVPNITVDDVKKYEYDSLNRLVRIQQIGNTSDGTGLAEINRFEYDSSGNRIWKVEKEARKTYYVRDPSGQVLSEFRSLDANTQFREWSSDYVSLAGRLLGIRENLKPAIPTGLRATQASQGPGAWRITLTWDENTEVDKSYYKVFRKVDGTDPDFVLVSPANQPTTATYADLTNHAVNKTVRYKVSVMDTDGYASDQSQELVVVTGDTAGPTAPTLSLGAVGDRFVRLTWTSGTDTSGIIGFEVSRRTSTGNNVPSLPITGPLIKVASFVDLNLTNGQTYYYRVRSLDSTGNWGPMSCQPGGLCDLPATPQDRMPPAPPKGLQVTSTCGASSGAEKINLAWEANAPVGTYTINYEIYRHTAPIYDYMQPPLTPIASVSTTTYQDITPLTPGTTYYYAVKAKHLGGSITNTSLFSKCVAGKVRDSSTTPNLQIFTTASDGEVKLTWQLPDPASPPNPQPSQYLIYRKLNATESCANYVQVATTGAAGTSATITDAGVPNNFAYDYAIAAKTGGVESSFSKPTLAIPLDRPSGLFQCRTPDPWSGADSTVVQWQPPAGHFYQPSLATTSDGTFSYLKGYHLYHYKLCKKMLGTEPDQNQDDSPTRVLKTDASTLDPYLIFRPYSSSTMVYQDPRYPITAGQVLSPQFQGLDTDVGVPVFGDCTENNETNCVMPKAVYKVFAEGTWMTAESDWPDNFDTLHINPSLRCKSILHKPAPSYPYCADGRPSVGDPNFVPPPRKVTATQAGPGSIRLDWVAPIVAPGRPPIAGYYLYARRNGESREFKHPLPFGTAGPNESTVTLNGLARAGGLAFAPYEFSVNAFDTAGRVSGKDFICQETGNQCTLWTGCPYGVKFCDNTQKLCAGQADCSYGVCTVSGASCSAAGVCPAGVCSNNHSVGCTPIRFIQSQTEGNVASNAVHLTNPPTNGNTLIAVVGTRGATDSQVLSISQPGTSWTRAIQKTNTNGVTVEIWYTTSLNSAGSFVTFNMPAAPKASAVVAEYSGIVTSSALDKTWTASGRSSSPNTGTTSMTSQGNEIWIGGMANINTNTYSLQTGLFTERGEAASYGGDNSLLNNTVFEELIQTAQGQATVGATLTPSQNQYWAGAIATFKTVALESTQCGAGNTCTPQTCNLDDCTGESCEDAIGRWCSTTANTACTQSTDCPAYHQGHCNISQAPCDPATTPNPCPTGQVCAPGDVCRNAYNVASVLPGAETASPEPPASLKTVLWTLNDAVLSKRGRNGVRLAWKGVTGASGYRVYRSAAPEGPFCALLDSGATPAPPLPAEAPIRCTSDISGWTVDMDAASIHLSTTSSDYWDQTVISDKIYHYRVTTVAGSGETPMSAAHGVTGRELTYDKAVLPPLQGFKAWAPQTGNLVDKSSVALKWCATPAPSSGSADVLPTLVGGEYRVYRTGDANQNGEPGAYRLLARLSPACLDTNKRCEILSTNACVDSNYLPKWNANGTPNCPIIPATTTCNNTTGPLCAIEDRTFQCRPRRNDGVGYQYTFNYRYFATAVGTLAGNPQAESMPSAENTAWLNYCGYPTNCTSSPTTCYERRDPDGNGETLICGDEDARLMSPDGPIGPTPATIAAVMTWEQPAETDGLSSLIAPQRIIGQGNPYTPPARFVFYHLDHLGSARLELDINGDLVAQHHYLPFGEERPPQVDPTLSTRAFTGHERDKESGLDYMLARYYSSSLGRFMAVDPATASINPANPQTWNRYSYVLNNPLVLIDPSGETVTVSGSDPAKKKFTDTANSGMHGKEAKVDSNGNVTLQDNGMQGPPSPEQAAFEGTMSQAIGDSANTSLSLVEGSSLTVIDSFQAQEVDMNDVGAYGEGPGASAPGMLAHSIAEQYAKQVGGISDFKTAHFGPGIAAENGATGYSRGAEQGGLVHNARTGDISGRITTPYTRGGEVVNVTTTVRGGNVTKVAPPRQ